MKLDRHNQRVEFVGEQGDKLTVEYDNRGEPYREGIALDLEDRGQYRGRVFLEAREAGELRDLIDRLYPKGKP